MPAIGIVIVVAIWIWFGALGSRAYIRDVKAWSPEPMESFDLLFALILLLIGPWAVVIALVLGKFKWQQRRKDAGQRP